MFFFLFGVASPHNRPNAQDHFAGAERLRHVIVGAKLQADNSIDLFRLRSQHHDWDLARRGIAFQDFADFQPRHFRQHEIENEKVRFLGARFLQTANTVRSGRDNESTCFAQAKREKIDNIAFILDDQNCFAGSRFHFQQLYRRK